MPAPPRREADDGLLRRQSHAPERPPAGLSVPLTPSQARALRQQARASGSELTPSQERAVRQALQQRLLRRCRSGAAPREPSAALRADMQDKVLQEMLSVDFA